MRRPVVVPSLVSVTLKMMRAKFFVLLCWIVLSSSLSWWSGSWQNNGVVGDDEDDNRVSMQFSLPRVDINSFGTHTSSSSISPPVHPSVTAPFKPSGLLGKGRREEEEVVAVVVGCGTSSRTRRTPIYVVGRRCCWRPSRHRRRELENSMAE